MSNTDDKVVKLENYKTKKPDLIWECNCGGQLFWLHKDGAVECRDCKTVKSTLRWGLNS